MDSKRKEIRNKIKDILVNADTFARSNVHASKKTPIEFNDLPSICVYLSEEDYTSMQRTARRNVKYRYDIEVQVEIFDTKATDEALADGLDDDLKEVHDAILEDETLGGLVQAIMPNNAKFTIDRWGSAPVGAVQVVYNLAYFD